MESVTHKIISSPGNVIFAHLKHACTVSEPTQKSITGIAYILTKNQEVEVVNLMTSRPKNMTTWWFCNPEKYIQEADLLCIFLVYLNLEITRTN